ncbi:unnamed protein product [marine sediment metagenome]|uniref:Uncharacterized protein n=1 Tax=marine sediment metagenome TaxID=412755 RepID=X0RR27_9ZZZZ
MTELIGSAEEVVEEIHAMVGQGLAEVAVLMYPNGDAPPDYFRDVDASIAAQINEFVLMTGGDGCECQRARQAVAETLRSSYVQLVATTPAAGNA